jgi:hypothetical protein
VIVSVAGDQYPLVSNSFKSGYASHEGRREPLRGTDDRAQTWYPTGARRSEDDVHDPVLGPLTRDPRFGWHESQPKAVRFLGLDLCRFVLRGYGSNEAHRSEIRRAVQNALDAGPDVLTAAQPYVVQYCEEMLARFVDESRPNVRLEKPSDVWSYVRFGRDLHVRRRVRDDVDDGVYVSIECHCDWEPKHGMQLVLRDGRAVSKVGPHDGHLTNADAYADPNLVGVVYVPLPPPRRRR